MTSTLRIGILIHGNSEWLGSDLVNVADEALSAHEDGKHALAVLKVGACLEGLLMRTLRAWELPTDIHATLGPLTGSIRKSSRAPDALLERLNEANAIRNRAAHNKPLRLSRVTEGDSLQIINILAMVVDWYQEQFRPEPEAGALADPLPIFLSVGGPHRLDQEQFLQHVRAEMRSLSVDLRALTSGEYSEKKPFDQICEVLSSCRGALVVGLERSHAYTVFEREKSERERLYQDQLIPTAWNQIEASLASALRLPILVLRQRALRREGIFEAENHRHNIRDFDLDVESRGLSTQLRDLLAGWVQHTRALV